MYCSPNKKSRHMFGVFLVLRLRPDDTATSNHAVAMLFLFWREPVLHVPGHLEKKEENRVDVTRPASSQYDVS